MLRHKRRLWLSFFLVIAGLLPVSVTYAAPAPQGEAAPPVYVYLYWGEGCPHCEQAKPFLEDLTQRYPKVQLLSFEVYNSEDNLDLFTEMAAAHGFEPSYVPTIFVGQQHWEGFADSLREEIEAVVAGCVDGGCPDPGAGIVPGHDAPSSALQEPGEYDTESGVGPESGADVTLSQLPIVLFWGDVGCVLCETTQSHHTTQAGYVQIGEDSGREALRFLRSLQTEYPGVEVNAYDVWISSTYTARFERVAGDFGVEAAGVPMIFVGDRSWAGFSADTANEVTTYVQHCLEDGCPGPLDEAHVAPESVGDVVPEDATVPLTTTEASSIVVPILGSVSLGEQSLWLSTALISLADGFNPCSLWVLSILIALSLRSGSRRRIFTIGIIYITVTAGVYVLFIAGLFTFLTLVSFMGWIQVVVSVLALFFAAVNIKDYFWYKEGLSFTIADEKKPGIYRRIRRVLNAGDSFWVLAGATVALGAGVSLVEFSCTAGFPVVWTNLVTAQGTSPTTFVLLLLLYMLVYQIDELAIFAVAVLTLKAGRLEEKHGRVLKLVGGMLMLMLSLVMLFKPALMSNLGSSLLVFGGALIVSLVILVVHRRWLPRLGVHIGTEFSR